MTAQITKADRPASGTAHLRGMRDNFGHWFKAKTARRSLWERVAEGKKNADYAIYDAPVNASFGLRARAAARPFDDMPVGKALFVDRDWARTVSGIIGKTADIF